MADNVNPQAVIDATLALIKSSQQTPNNELAKAWTQSGSAISGITAYDLEAGAKLLYPVITPLRNRIPRTSGKGGIQANWRAITGVNTGNLSVGVGGGNRSGVMSSTTKDYIAAYRTIGLEDYATFEAELAAQGFDDLKARAVEGLLRALMIGEEKVIVGGNSSVALGTTPTPTLATATTGGTIANAAAYSVICVALTFEGYQASSVSATGVIGAVTRTNADASTDTYGGGSAQQSASATVATTGSGTSTVSASVTPVKGAFAYAWFGGATAGTERIAAITTINSVVITAAPSGTNQLASAIASPSQDNSLNTFVFDGVLTQINTANSNSYIATMATGTAGTGTPLTSDTAGGIVEIDTALKSFWDNYRLSPTDIYVSSQEMMNITKKILAASSTAAQRFVFNSDQGMLAGGSMVRSYLNKFAMDGAVEIPVRLHPNMPSGTIMFFCDRLPYPLSNVSNVLQIRARRDYYQIEWPLRSRKYEYGVYADEVLQNYFPPAFGMITNIANG
jgi:hypothetical protein